MTEPLYKWLDDDRSSYHRGKGVWTPGRWRSVSGPLEPCVYGLHLCRERDLAKWCAPALWLAEADGERMDAGNKVVVSRARITEQLTGWNERTARLFAADCAERTLLREREAGREPDARSWEVVRVARAFARGEVDDAARAAVWAAGWAAASDAGWAASRAAAWAASRDAAWAAAWAAAGDAAWNAARAAAWDAAGDALAPTTEWLQASAVELVNRMIAEAP